MLDDSLKRLIDRELNEINMLLERSANLLKVASNREPTFERLAALSQVLISFYSHAYAHHLEWPRMKGLVLRVSDTWDRVRSEIQRFIEGRPQLGDGDEGA